MQTTNTLRKIAARIVARNAVNFVAAIASILLLGASSSALSQNIYRGGNGSAASPTFSFNSDPDTGAYRVGANSWGVAVGGNNVLSVANSAITASQPLLFSADNTHSIGQFGASRPSTVYASQGLHSAGYVYGETELGTSAGGNYYFAGRMYLRSGASGNLSFTDAAGTNFGLLQLGGTSSSYPALKRSSATLQARLADDSAYAAFDALSYAVGGVAGASGTCSSVVVTAGIVTTCTP